MILAFAIFAFIIFLFASSICLEIDDLGGRVEWSGVYWYVFLSITKFKTPPASF